jgi:hypothetical protein
VGAAEQRAALDTILSTIKPSELKLPAALLDRLPPRPSGFGRTRELFPRFTGGAFDPITPAMVAAQHAIGQILTPTRAARLVTQHSLDPSLPGLTAVIARIVEVTFPAAPIADAYEAEIARAIQRVVADQIMALAANADMPQVRAEALMFLDSLAGRGTGGDEAWRAHRNLLIADIKRFRDRPMEPVRPATLPGPPPGAPIGDLGLIYCDQIFDLQLRHRLF